MTRVKGRQDRAHLGALAGFRPEEVHITCDQGSAPSCVVAHSVLHSQL
jgi:hypothetical protein